MARIDLTTIFCTDENMICLGFESKIVNRHYYNQQLNYIVYSDSGVQTMTIQDIIDAYQNHEDKIFPESIIQQFVICSTPIVCEEITLGDYTGGLTTITGGTPQYELEVVDGEFPVGCTIAYLALGPTNYWHIVGTPVSGNYIFTLGGVDANDCPVTEKVYNITI